MNPEWMLVQEPLVFQLDKKIFIKNYGAHSVSFSVCNSSSFTVVKLAGAWSWPLPSDAKFKNDWSYTLIPPYAFVAWMIRDKFTLILCVENSLGLCHGIGNHLPFCFLGGHVQSQASSCGICGGHSGNGTGFTLSSSYSPCHCHSSSSPHSFIHLSEMQYNLSNWQCC